jgi:hypothetical protein
MAYHTKLPIVTDGLVFSVDPYNTKSYVSGDTTTYDLTKNKYSGTLTNGVGFDVNGWTFDGANQWVDFGSSGISDTIRGYTQFSCDFWLKKSDNNSNFIIGDYNGPSGWWCQWGSGTNNTLYVGVNANSNSLVLPTFENRWYHITSVWNLDAGANVDKGKLYVDGVLQTTTTNNLSNSSVPAGSRIFAIGSVQGTSVYYDGDLSEIKIYDKILTADEVLQNHNALKYRFV